VSGTTRRVLVTGSSGNLGSQLCAHFLAGEDTVVGIDVTPPGSPPMSGGGDWRFVACDLADSAMVEQTLSAELAEHGPFDVVVNNVGLIHSAPVISLVNGRLVHHDFGSWDRVISVTLSATFYVTALCAQALVTKRRRGAIVNISSISAAGNTGQAAYSAAKAGINALTVALANELGPLGVRVVAIAPGFLDTESTQEALGDDALARVRAAVPLRRLGTTAELCQAVDFAVENGYFDGRVLELDGGLRI
jgi:3-oxoacyl-[acyl-carrier protein] reductase